MMTDRLQAADCRRATALVCHYGRRNADGVNEIFHETVEANRVSELLMATASLYSYITPVLVTQLGMRCLSETVMNIAKEGANESGRRAAKLIIAHSAADVDAINAVLKDAKEANAITDLFMSMMNIYAMLVPALTTNLGLTALQSAILEIAVLETENPETDE